MVSYHFRIFSKASFDSPYGLMGRGGVSASIGTRSGGAKVAEVEERTRRFTSAVIMASSKFKPAAILLRKYLEGFSIDSPTSALAAKCITASGRSCAKV